MSPVAAPTPAELRTAADTIEQWEASDYFKNKCSLTRWLIEDLRSSAVDIDRGDKDRRKARAASCNRGVNPPSTAEIRHVADIIERWTLAEPEMWAEPFVNGAPGDGNRVCGTTTPTTLRRAARFYETQGTA